LAQIKESLDGWSSKSVDLFVQELAGLSEIQSAQAAANLRNTLPSGVRNAVNTVEISPQFARSVVMTDPLDTGIAVLSDELSDIPAVFKLTARQGAVITLPGGGTVQKAFRGLAEQNAAKYGQIVRDGLLTGDTTDQIYGKLVGGLHKLRFGQRARSARQLAQAGGQVTGLANRQIMTLVRTTINQVSTTASRAVYEANRNITSKYQYIATLDSRTSPICRELDSKDFAYGEGPMPPQHFNCRSTIVPVVDFEALGLPKPPEGMRSSSKGQVPADMTYGEWIYSMRDTEEGKKEISAAFKTKAPYFMHMANKFGPNQAIRKFLRSDGSEITLDVLRKRYPNA
jgi:SPP1 gp7 family putative phage head morphogenesis protein|tara:strand:+ start:5067 stop:6092 length:1026 start_codon:yes stop_codon:yes gene_type:complete